MNSRPYGPAIAAAILGQVDNLGSTIDSCQPALVDTSRPGHGGKHSKQGSLQFVHRTLVQPLRGPARNQACWCGSGRKRKKCHTYEQPKPPESNETTPETA